MLEGISLIAILKIIAIDVVLSGDNAVVIALASRSLPSNLQRKAIVWGGAGAIGLRVLVTALVAYLLNVPLLQLLGGLFLLWVSYKLLVGEDETQQVKAGANLREAIVTIIAADFVMSLDNMLAVGGASHGSMVLLFAGLLISMGVIMFFSGIIAKLMNRFAWLIYVGSAILAWTAADMVLQDRLLDRYLAPSDAAALVIDGVVTGLVLLLGHLAKGRAAARAKDAGHADRAD